MNGKVLAEDSVKNFTLSASAGFGMVMGIGIGTVIMGKIFKSTFKFETTNPPKKVEVTTK